MITDRPKDTPQGGSGNGSSTDPSSRQQQTDDNNSQKVIASDAISHERNGKLHAVGQARADPTLPGQAPAQRGHAAASAADGQVNGVGSSSSRGSKNAGSSQQPGGTALLIIDMQV